MLEKILLLKAEIDDLPLILEVIESCKRYLKNLSIDQWQDGYPNEKIIENDIVNEVGYIITYGNEKIGYVCLDYNEEKAYSNEKIKWKSDKKYLAIHRFAINEKYRGRHLSKEIFKLFDLKAIEYKRNLRVDTHSDNKIMQKVLKNANFEFCGITYYNNGNDERLAFEKVLF